MRSVYTLKEEQIVGIRDYMGYFPRENLVELSSADLSMNQWETSGAYYRISPEHQWEQAPVPEGTPGELKYLRGAMSGADILAELEP